MAIDTFDDLPDSVKAAALNALEESTSKLVCKYALQGDHSCAGEAVCRIYTKISDRERLANFEVEFLLVLLSRIGENTQALNVVSGASNKKGRASNGYKGMRIANSVWREVLTSGMSVEAAWEAVAEKEHLSPSMVKRHWTKWKDPVRESKSEYVDIVMGHLKDDLADGD